jgi:hypothetical protein
MIDGSLQRLPFTTLKIILTSTTPWNVPSRIYTPRFMCTITGLILLLHPMVGSIPSNVFVTYPNRPRIAIRYTRATWMRLAMIFLGNLGLACNFETYRYSLPPAHMPLLFSCIYTTSPSLWPRTSPREVNHHHICFIPIYNSSYISLDPFFFLSLDRPFM